MFRKTVLAALAVSVVVAIGGCKDLATDTGTGQSPSAPSIISDEEPAASDDTGAVGDDGVEATDDAAAADQTKPQPNRSKRP